MLVLPRYTAAMRTLRSDNNAGICPEAMDAIAAANSDHAIAYGDDAATVRAVEAFQTIFGPRTSVFLVASGTAANTLAIASMTRPWQTIICHRHSHCSEDESTAPERISQCRMRTIETDDAKITPDDLARVLATGRDDLHQPRPGVVSITNTSEFGAVYTPDEVAALCRLAHDAGYRVHMDGARFANAVAALDCDPRALTVDAGIDALSFGGTKNGLALGEAVLFFPQGDGTCHARATEDFPFHRKSTGHLLSKHRFVAAAFEGTLRNASWLKHAAYANAMARRLADGLARLGIALRYPCDANAVFAEFPDSLHRQLTDVGHGYYPFGEPSWRMYRLMCSFDTQPEEIDRFLADVRAGLSHG